MHNIHFKTKSFRDSKSIAEENVNMIEGKGLAQGLSVELLTAGWLCEDVFDEDFGWAFYASKGNEKYFMTASVDSDDNDEDVPDDYPPVGASMFVNINIERQRSLWEKIKGANKQTASDSVTALVEAWIASQDDVTALEVMR